MLVNAICSFQVVNDDTECEHVHLIDEVQYNPLVLVVLIFFYSKPIISI